LKDKSLPPVVVLQSGLSALPKLYAMLYAQKTGSVNEVEIASCKNHRTDSFMLFGQSEIQNTLSSAHKELERAEKETQEV
jgi:hypothetical protein